MRTKSDTAAEKILRNSQRPLSTYEIAKRARMSWSTANMHLFKLMAFGVVHGLEEDSSVGTGKKMVWWVNKKK